MRSSRKLWSVFVFVCVPFLLTMLLYFADRAEAQGLIGHSDTVFSDSAHGYPLVKGANDSERLQNWRRLQKTLTGKSEEEIVAALGPGHRSRDGLSIVYQLCQTRRAPGQKRGLAAKILTIELAGGKATAFEIESAHWTN